MSPHGIWDPIDAPGPDSDEPLTPDLLDIAMRLAHLRAQGAAVLVSSVGRDPIAIRGRLMGYVVALEDSRVGKREAEIIELCNRVIMTISEGRAV